MPTTHVVTFAITVDDGRASQLLIRVQERNGDDAAVLDGTVEAASVVTIPLGHRPGAGELVPFTGSLARQLAAWLIGR